MKRRKSARLRCGGALLACMLLAACAVPELHDGEVRCRVYERTRTCAAVPLAPRAADTAAKMLDAPPAGTGRIYLMRPYRQEWKQRTRVYLDGNLVARLGPATYAVLDVRPGTHRVVFDGGQQLRLALRVEAGQLYFGMYQVRLWLWDTERSARWISAGDAASVLQRARRAELVDTPSPSS